MWNQKIIIRKIWKNKSIMLHIYNNIFHSVRQEQLGKQTFCQWIHKATSYNQMSAGNVINKN